MSEDEFFEFLIDEGVDPHQDMEEDYDEDRRVFVYRNVNGVLAEGERPSS